MSLRCCTNWTTKRNGTVSLHLKVVHRLCLVRLDDDLVFNTSVCEPNGHVSCIYSVLDSIHARAGSLRVHARSSTDSVNW